MSHTFRQIDRETLFLLPPSLDDWLPEEHLARFIVEIVAQFDLTSIKAAYAGRGSKAHHPEMLLALLFYGYATGVFSSRKLERATYDSVAFRYIAANDHPDHDTIATFRKRFLLELNPLFVQILQIAHQMKVLKLGKISLDGTKIKANASKHRALSWEYACKLEINSRVTLKTSCDKLKKPTGRIFPTVWIFLMNWRVAKSAFPPLQKPKLKSSDVPPSALLKNRQTTRRNSTYAKTKSKKPARRHEARNQSLP
jgi:transposase